MCDFGHKGRSAKMLLKICKSDLTFKHFLNFGISLHPLANWIYVMNTNPYYVYFVQFVIYLDCYPSIFL